MFHINNRIVAGFSLAVFLACPVSYAADTGTASAATTTSAQTASDSAAPTAKKPVKKKSEASSAPAQTATATTTVDMESPEAVRQRSGNGDPVAGKDKSEFCQGCHGEEGISSEPTVPKLAGQYASYIIKELRNFQDGTRVHQIMSDVAKTVNDDDLTDIAAYFASRTKMKGNGSDNKLGEQLFLHGDMSRMMVACVNCHGAHGKGKTPTNPVFPVIGGQHKDYLTIQLQNFRAGNRTNSPGGVMNIITQRLTDAELDALADYVSGQ